MSAETFTGPDGREYFRHVPLDIFPCDGDGCPCDPEASVFVIFRSGDRSANPYEGRDWVWTLSNESDDIFGWRYADEQPEQPAKIPDPWKDEREKLQARVRELEEALQGLFDWQNGCPLPTWEEGWTKAMEAARKALHHKTPEKSA